MYDTSKPIVVHHPVRLDWLKLRHEEAIEPQLPIVDSHHHLWDHPGHRYFMADLLEDVAGGHLVQATVATECGAMYRMGGDPAMRPVGETEFLNGIAAMSASGNYGPCRVAAAIVGNADFCLGDKVKPVLEAHVRAGGGRFRGIRYNSVWHADPTARGSMANPPPGVLGDATFRRGFAALAPLNLSFDAWMYHTQLAEGVDLARSFPDTTIILNHCGGALGIGPYTGKRDEVFAQWRMRMTDMARCENVFVKVGGLGMRLYGFDFTEQPKPPTSEELAQAWRPYVLTCIDIFGAERCMFESNFPVDKGSCSYNALWNAFKRITADLSPRERTALFAGTAARVYRLGD